MTDYCYLITVDAQATLRNGIAGKYKAELAALLSPISTPSVYSEQRRVALTKEQLALFFYLRCRMGGNNGVKDLDMKRHDASKELPKEVVDLRGSCTGGGPDEQPVDNPVELATQLQQVDKLLAQIDRGEPLRMGQLVLNNDHMQQVLKVQRNHIRAKIIAAISVGV